MIGVIVDESERAVVSEFFELFKTPWEWWQSNRKYEVVLCTAKQRVEDFVAKLTLLYSGAELEYDEEKGVSVAPRQIGRTLSHGGNPIPIYGDCITFPEQESGGLLEENSQHPAMHQLRTPNGLVLRIGYDLFREVELLLTVGQPAANASIPTLELHIALLRDLIVSAGDGLVEIPPVPEGFRFIVCLTHDIDHPSIRKHICDRTMLGFLYRAVIGSVGNVLRGSISLRDVLTNWAAVLRLPLVYLGFAKDFWRDFVSCYRDLEQELPSTYFVIPFANRPGCDAQGSAPAYRASRYGAGEIADLIADALSNGCEVALHGIDAWADSDRGREELEEIRQISGRTEFGSRMHWLYFDENAPPTLEKAGIVYDSTIGYRETVGFRTGTTQAYKPLQAERLLELPLHVMDTALFYPAYLGLTSEKATEVIDRLTDQVEHFGGCLVINWHDRSLAPERLWYACYGRLLKDLKARGAWFATTGQAVAWFRKRRSVALEGADAHQRFTTLDKTRAGEDRLPRLRFRFHNAPLTSGRREPGDCLHAPFSFDAAV